MARNSWVLDSEPAALARSQERLGKRTTQVRWIVADVLDAPLPAASCAVWHDRAVFHFLTDARDHARYVAQVDRVVRPGGHVIVASFGPDGPARCSGLEVMRYSPEGCRPRMARVSSCWIVCRRTIAPPVASHRLSSTASAGSAAETWPRWSPLTRLRHHPSQL